VGADFAGIVPLFIPADSGAVEFFPAAESEAEPFFTPAGSGAVARATLRVVGESVLVEGGRPNMVAPAIGEAISCAAVDFTVLPSCGACSKVLSRVVTCM
jgi:hypothetical protein